MAEAVAQAFDTGEHLAVQAGTGTGKSLAYLVPAIARAVETDCPVVVSTATIALQRQLVERDLPRLADSLESSLPRRPSFAILKGRGNYLCLNKIHNGSADPNDTGNPPEALFEPTASTGLGRDVQRLTAWASTSDTGDRDELAPGVPDRSWSQVSVSARECLGVARCPFGGECFAEKARGNAGRVDIVVTNHALLAIDALSDAPVLPEHDLLVIDEAHELVDKVTGVATQELSSTPLAVAARRIGRLVETEIVERLDAAAAAFTSAIRDMAPGRIDHLDEGLALHLAALRDAANAARRAVPTATGDARANATRTEAIAALDEIAETCSRTLESFRHEIPDRTDIVWIARDDNRGHVYLRVAPLSVAALLRGGLFHRATAVLTSATLTPGGSFDSVASEWGLASPGHRGASVARHRRGIALLAREIGHLVRRAPPATARQRRYRIGRAVRRDHGTDRRRARPHARPVLVDARGRFCRRGNARTACDTSAVPG